MSSNSIANAALILSTNNSALDAGLAQAKSSIMSFGASFGGIQTFGTGLWGGFIAGARKALDQVEASFDRLKSNFGGAKKLGVSPEEFAQLAAAAQIAGVPMENMSKSLNKLVKNISDLKAGDEGAKKAFAGIGLSAEDMQGNALDSVSKISQALGKLSDPADKAAMLLHLGGKSATDLLPLLNNYDSLTEKAKKFYDAENSGNQDTANAARAWRTVQVAINSVWDRITQALTPAIASLAETLEWWATNLSDIMKGIGSFMDGVKNTILDAIQAMLRGLGWLADAAAKLPLVGESIKGLGDDARRYAEALNVLREPAKVIPAPKPKDDTATRLQLELQTAAAELTKKLTDEAAAFGKTGTALEAFKLKQKGLKDAIYDTLKPLADQVDRMQKAMSLVEQNPIAKFADELAGLQDLMMQGTLSWDEYTRAINKASQALISQAKIEQRHASAQIQGSQEAANTVLQNQVQNITPQEQVKNAIDQLKEIQKRTAISSEGILRAISGKQVELIRY